MRDHINRIARASLVAVLLLTTLLAGGGASAAVRGTVVAWGFGQASLPAGLSDVKAIAGGHAHSLALKGDGTVVAWGDNYYGQTNLPADLRGVKAIAAGGYHSMALIRNAD
jgi:alpha-tubulin suppressor-like RCC1 family protein